MAESVALFVEEHDLSSDVLLQRVDLTDDGSERP